MEPNVESEEVTEKAEAEPTAEREELAEEAMDPEVEAPAPQNSPEMAYSWHASEYVHHHKSPLWYIVLGSAVVLLAALAVWMHLWLEIGVFVLAGIAIMVYASKPPRTLLYELSVDGVHIDGRLYPFSAFRSFSVVQDTEWHSIDLEPMKRLSPRLVMLFDSPDFDQIVGHLELHLPREDREPDMIERISRYVRF